MKKITAIKTLWRAVFWANWIVIFSFWWYGSGQLLLGSLGNVLISLGRLAGLAAGYLILLQFFLMGRNPLLERFFGLDRLSRIHQRHGKWAMVVLLFHPVLLTFGYSLISKTSFLHQFASFFFEYEHVALAVIGFVLFLIVVAISLSIIRLRLRYETWYLTHIFVYLAIGFTFLHQFEVGTDLVISKFFYGYWIVLYLFVFASHLVFRFGRPIYMLKKHDFHISRIVRETPTAISIYISGKNMNEFKIHPGQFMIVRFLTKKLWWQAHPFSLSMIPDGNEIRITPKEVGDFTKSLAPLLTPGTKIMIDGPYGVFTNLFSIGRKVLMVAGGIGITPIRSLSEEMLAEGKDVVLLYANRNEAETVFKDELSGLQEKYGNKMVHIMSQDPNFNGEKGIIDEEKLRRLVPDINEREVYLCGPVPMMNGLIPVFKKLGVPKDWIHYERFAF